MIALIEDSLPIAQLIITALEMRNYAVKHFSEGASFFLSLQNTFYDVVLVDLTLPAGGVSGLQVISFLREMYPALPIIVVSAAGENILASLHTLYPDLPIIRKPFKMQELVQEIARVRTIQHD
jgi:DNA-binding response OmpR family regulator